MLSSFELTQFVREFAVKFAIYIVSYYYILQINTIH